MSTKTAPSAKRPAVAKATRAQRDTPRADRRRSGERGLSEKETQGVRLLRLRDVLARCGLAKASLYRLVRMGLFPLPLKLSDDIRARAVAWRSDEVAAWIAERTREGRFTPTQWKKRSDDIARYTHSRPRKKVTESSEKEAA